MHKDRRYTRLITELCVRYGWCGSAKNGQSTHVDFYIPSEGAVTADKFVHWLIEAERVTPYLILAEEREALRAAFVRHMGADVVDASLLKWRHATSEELTLEIREDDLSASDVQALIGRHLAGMHENSPAESVHAFDLDKLRQPGVTFWVGRVDGVVAVMGALKMLNAEDGEIKSMRVADAYLGKGLGHAMLDHIMFEAVRAKLKTLWLETGSTPAFDPALKLYESAGFTFCGPFGSYTEDPFSRFMTKTL